MKSREQRYNELYSSGLVDAVKSLFANRSDISEDYYVFMADYIDSMDEIKNEMLINPTEIAKKMPELVKSIQETNLGGIYGRTDDGRIQINQSLSYEEKKLYFFHELTHALQTFYENGRELCGFYNGHNGMFLTEGATQYTAEMLYNVSNGISLEHRQQPGTVRGASNRTPHSPLSEYQYNGNVLELLARSMDLPLPQVLALAYKKNGRETLKSLYESMDGNQGKFDELMNNLEQIYTIDKLIIYGYWEQLQSQTPINITMMDRRTTFKGNLTTYRNLMDKVERELLGTYIENHEPECIAQNYSEISQFLTTQELRNTFLSAIHQLGQELPQDNYREWSLPEGYSINEFGEIIRPSETEVTQTSLEVVDNTQPSFVQKIAQLLQKTIMNIENFVGKQLNLQEHNLKLPPVRQMSNPEKIARMRDIMENDTQYQKMLNSIRGCSRDEYEKRCKVASNEWKKKKVRSTHDRNNQNEISR